MKQLTDVTLVVVSTEDVEAAVAALDYCISLTAQREDSCSTTGRVRRAHPTTPLATSGYRLKKPDTFT